MTSIERLLLRILLPQLLQVLLIISENLFLQLLDAQFFLQFSVVALVLLNLLLLFFLGLLGGFRVLGFVLVTVDVFPIILV